MKRLALLLTACVLAIGAGPTITVPGEIKAKPGRMAQIIVTTTGKQLKYINPAADDVDMFREYDPDPTHFTYRFLADKPGVYRVHFYTAAGDVPSDPACTKIIVGDPPAPTPPTPPAPPVPVPPADPLAAALATAYAAEKDADKAGQVAQLAALYKVASKKTVNDASLATTADLFTKVQTARRSLLDDTALTLVRRVIGDEMNKVLGPVAALDAAKRQQAGDTFARIAANLEGLK